MLCRRSVVLPKQLSRDGQDTPGRFTREALLADVSGYSSAKVEIPGQFADRAALQNAAASLAVLEILAFSRRCFESSEAGVSWQSACNKRYVFATLKTETGSFCARTCGLRSKNRFRRIEKLMAEQLNFADSVAQHLPSLTRMVLRLMRGHEMADDVVQNTVLKALIHADQFRSDSSLKTWLGSIAINEVYQLYRSKWQKRTVSLATEALRVLGYQAVVLPSDYETKERGLLVRRAVSFLPQSYRSVVELCDFQQLSMNEAGAKLGLTSSAVKSRLYRARKKLQHLITIHELN